MNSFVGTIDSDLFRNTANFKADIDRCWLTNGDRVAASNELLKARSFSDNFVLTNLDSIEYIAASISGDGGEGNASAFVSKFDCGIYNCRAGWIKHRPEDSGGGSLGKYR